MRRPPDDAEIRRLRTPLLRWFRNNARELPWRDTRDPYAIWVSEVMLQQTQVATVASYYVRFLARFPDPASLAAASEDDVLSLWSGLGYYRRARSLHAGARAVMEHHRGRVPADPQALKALPGIGRYTAGAIASIAFGAEEPILDGNVRRVLSRLFAIDVPDAELWRIAARLVPGRDPGDLNQSLMELGALICTPKGASCERCPVSRFCRARDTDTVEAYPAPLPRAPLERVRVGILWIVRAGSVLLERPAATGPLRGRWDLPAVELTAHATPDDIASRLAQRHGLELAVGRRLTQASHGIMNRRLTLEAHAGRLRRGRVRCEVDLRWVRTEAIDDVPVSGATLKLSRKILAHKSSTASSEGALSIGP